MPPVSSLVRRVLIRLVAVLWLTTLVSRFIFTLSQRLSDYLLGQSDTLKPKRDAVETQKEEVSPNESAGAFLRDLVDTTSSTIEAGGQEGNEAEPTQDIIETHFKDTESESSEPNTNATAPPGMGDEVLTLYQSMGKGYTDWVECYPTDAKHDYEELVGCARHALVVKKVMNSDIDDEDGGEMQIHSIKIQSPLLRPIVSEILSGYPEFSSRSMEFERPFIPFFFRFEELKKVFKEHIRDDHDDEQKIKTTKHFVLFYDLIMADLEKTASRSQKLREMGQISAKYCWTLFPPGTMVITRKSGRERILRVTKPNTTSGGYWTTLHSRYVAWDGKMFGYVEENLRISGFSGISRIEDLSIIPLHSHADHSGVELRLQQRGNRYLSLSGEHYKRCHGLIEEAAQSPEWEGFNKPRYTTKETVITRVFVSTQLYKEYNKYSNISVPNVSPLEENDKEAPRHTSVRRGFALNYESDEDSDDETNGISKSLQNQIDSLSYENILMCDTAIYGYSFNTKSWGKFRIEHIYDIAWDKMTFHSLVLEQQYKDLILSMVNTQIQGGNEFDDFISGKGQGLTMLFAGPPGVGKTLTVEAIAEHMRKPLYMISAGELGLTPSSVEKKLKNIFELSVKMNAIVLLDEADVFLQERSINDLQRNALITIFLRILEYYKGVLFLTTNRVSAFDSAFISRIHLTITFPKLDAPARRLIWKSFLEKPPLQHNVTDSELDNIADKYDLNGRQIKNSMKTAQLCNHGGKILTIGLIRTVLEIAAEKSLSINGV